METLHIELDIEVEKAPAEIIGKLSEDLKAELIRQARQWVSRYLKSNIRHKKTPLREFIDNIDEYAVDTGIDDLSINHEYYLYGGPKRE